VVYGTNPPVCASETLLLRPRSKSLSPLDTHWRSLKALCKRSRAHNSKRYSRPLGYYSARSSRALRVSWLWLGGRPDRSPSIKPATPALLKSLTQWILIGAPLKSAFSPAREIGKLEPPNVASITRALCTSLRGYLRDFTNRLISASPSVVNVRNAIGFGIVSSYSQENNFNLIHEKII